MVDEYVKRLEDIKRRTNFRELRKTYKSMRSGELRGGIESSYEYNEEKFSKKSKADLKEKDIPYVASVAYRLTSEDNPVDILRGALLYEKIGRGNKPSVKNRLLKAAEKHPEKIDFEAVKQFFERNPSEKQQSKSLEGKTIVLFPESSPLNSGRKKLTAFFSGLSVLIALFFLSTNITGNVIGSLTNFNSSLFGIILFVFGLIGLYISFRNQS